MDLKYKKVLFVFPRNVSHISAFFYEVHFIYPNQHLRLNLCVCACARVCAWVLLNKWVFSLLILPVFQAQCFISAVTKTLHHVES